ncbi:MAG: LamG domain-containing protein [Candidatus Poribacteria bacterium]|nr:LamG domain-containing protein [Candidatus Poribacteria bacterium]
MFGKDSTRYQQRYFVNALRFFTITCLLLTCFVWNVQPVDAIIGAVEDGLVAYWTFDKDTVKIKTEAVDLLSGLAAAVHGDPELAAASDCKVGECILFDGSVDRLLVEDSTPPTIDRDWEEISLECWVYINALDDSWNRIISLDDMPSNTAVASLYYDDDDNQHGFFIRAGGQSTQAAKDNVLEDIPLEEWLHLTGTYDGSTVHYYVNGELEKKYAMKGGKLPKGGLLLGIGDRSDGCDCDTIQGYIDEFRIYDRVLTSAEVENNMKATGLDVSPSADHLSVTWGHIKARRR